MSLFDSDISARALTAKLLKAPDEARGELGRMGFRDPDRALRNLEGLVGPETTGTLPSVLFRELVETPDPDMALNNFERLSRSVFSPSGFFHELEDRPETCRILVRLLGSSQFVADVLVRDPQYFYWLTETPDRLSKPSTKAELTKTFERAVGAFEGLDHRLNGVRRAARRELLRIGASDLMDNRPIQDVTAELSVLADVCLQKLLDLLTPELDARYGTPRNQDGSRAEFVILGLGKLGGMELNFSSDVDLMFLYSEEGETDGGRSHHRPLTNQAYFSRLAEQVVEAATEVTEEGFLYRVDLRLRPDGSTGALTMPLAGYEGYYVRRGELWERQMLIKARPCAGSEDLGKRFLAAVQPFVYPRHFEVSPVREIHRIKGRIEERIGRKGKGETHLKLRSGGIRDIEFIVQCLQLMVGRVHFDARSGNTLYALSELKRVFALSPGEREVLEEAYLFFRRLEHRMQMMHGLSDYTLPEAEADQVVIARNLGFSSTEAYRAALEGHLEGVQGIYLGIFSAAPEGEGRSVGALCEREVGDPEAVALLQKLGFAQPEAAHRNLVFLAFGNVPRIRGTRARESFMALAPALMETLKASVDPDQGLSNLERLISAYGAGDTLFRILSSDWGLRDLMLKVCAGSQYLVNLVVRNPGLLDWLTRSNVLLQEPSAADFETELDVRMNRADTDDARMAALNGFKSRELLRIGTRDLLGLTGTFETFEALTHLADTLLKKVYQVAFGGLSARWGTPRKADGSPAEFVVLGLGKMGGRELNFGSDLDIVFVYSSDGETDGPQALGNLQFFVDLAQQIITMLEQGTVYGKLYPVDARLRPEGGSALMALSYEAYDRYLEKRASTWERLALSRSRVVAGDAGFGKRMMGRFEEFVLGEGLSESEIDELVDIRRRIQAKGGKSRSESLSIKTSPGGILDIEFIAQIMQIRHGRTSPGVRSVNTQESLNRLTKEGFLTDKDAAHLNGGFSFLRSVEKVMRRQDERARTRLPSNQLALTALARAVNFKEPGSFLAAVREEMARTRGIFERLIGKPN